MNNITKIIALVAVAVLATGAIAQGQGQGRGGGGQDGGQGRGGGQRGGMFGQQGGVMLLQRTDVQTDLNLNSEQKTALAGLQESMQTEMRSMFEEMRNGGGGFDREAMTAAMKKLTDGLTKKVDGILKPEQTRRLKEIDIQLAGNRAILREDVQKDLAFTPAQTAKVKDLQAKQQEANTAVMEKMRNGEIDREQIGEIRTKNDKVMSDELGKVTTAEQAGKLKAMAGKPFKADADGG